MRGKNISRDITKHLKKLGHEIEEKVVYKQRMTKAHGEIQKILNDRNLVGIAMFSEKSVEFLVENCSNIPIDKTFFCYCIIICYYCTVIIYTHNLYHYFPTVATLILYKNLLCLQTFGLIIDN